MNCTGCGRELPVGSAVIVIADAEIVGSNRSLDDNRVELCDCPNKETLCEKCAEEILAAAHGVLARREGKTS